LTFFPEQALSHLFVIKARSHVLNKYRGLKNNAIIF